MAPGSVSGVCRHAGAAGANSELLDLFSSIAKQGIGADQRRQRARPRSPVLHRAPSSSAYAAVLSALSGATASNDA